MRARSSSEILEASPPSSAVNAGEVFAPYRSRQQEVGVKFDHGRLITTASVFQIRRPSGLLVATGAGAGAVRAASVAGEFTPSEQRVAGRAGDG